ncbi:MAG: hypothetical protein AB8I08_40960 [Sandaracinaceae bacterium]
MSASAVIAVELTHAVVTVFMTAVIWFVQVVHYPLFARVGPSAFQAYEAAHVRRITWIVMPAMLLELVSATAIVLLGSAHWSPAAACAGLGLLVLIWASTGLVQVPLHRHLEKGLDDTVVARLVKSNWIRTAAWTARAGLVVLALATALR